MVERRDYWSRSLAYSRIVQWLKEQSHEQRAEGLPPSIDPVVAERILRRLAGRGLAKNDAGKWTATSALTHPAMLKKVED